MSQYPVALDLIAARKRAGASLEAVARGMGVSRQYVIGLEADPDRRIATRTVKRYLDAVSAVAAEGTIDFAVPGGDSYADAFKAAKAAFRGSFVVRLSPTDEPWWAVLAAVDAASAVGASSLVMRDGKVIRKS